MKRIVFKRLSDAERHELEAIREEQNGLCIESVDSLQNSILDGLCVKGIMKKVSRKDSNDLNSELPESIALHSTTYCASEPFMAYFRKHKK